MHHAEVEIVADSISVHGKRLTTWKLRYWRGIHSEMMTHRSLSKSAGSSRARPSQGIIDQVFGDPWGPLFWGKNEPGMQSHTEMSQEDKEHAQEIWRNAAREAANHAQGLLNIGAHKQIVNRILEPYTFIDVVLTGTEFNNLWHLRVDKGADPSFFDLASRMQKAYHESTPKLLKEGEYHLPFIAEHDWVNARLHLSEGGNLTVHEDKLIQLVIKMSVARCARTSYKMFDGTASTIEKDLDLYEKLIVSKPMHASPAEHQGTPDTFKRINSIDAGGIWENPHLHGNFVGWIQYRKTLPNEYVPG